MTGGRRSGKAAGTAASGHGPGREHGDSAVETGPAAGKAPGKAASGKAASGKTASGRTAAGPSGTGASSPPAPAGGAPAGDDRAGGPVLLSGGNPQIPKGYGEAPVAAYIAAMPGWKSAIGRRIDEIVTATVPGVAKAVKWNSPLYGIAGNGWFLGVHCFTHYVKVSFFRGARLAPPPPGPSKQAEVRYLDIREGGFDEEAFADWVRQASLLPGETM